MPTRTTLYLETTEVPAGRSAAEIVAELVKAGATSINTDYEDGVITGLRWIMTIPGRGNTLFAMPARVAPVYQLLYARRKGLTSAQDEARIRETARRVAWRQLLRWVQAQMAMIQCGMAEAGEVFFPYLQTPAGSSLYEVFRDQGLKLLEPGEPS